MDNAFASRMIAAQADNVPHILPAVFSGICPNAGCQCGIGEFNFVDCLVDIELDGPKYHGEQYADDDEQTDDRQP
ncbi:MAG: hypothetical protein P8X94_07920 [Woeseiaceae bacterium]